MGHYHNERRLWSLLAFLSLLTVIWGLQESPGPQDSRLLSSPRSRSVDNESNATRKRRSVLPINPWMTDIRSVLAEVKRFQDESKQSSGRNSDLFVYGFIQYQEQMKLSNRFFS